MYPPSVVMLKSLKRENVQKMKNEKRLRSEERLKLNKNHSESLKKRIKLLSEIEQSFLMELNSRKNREKKSSRSLFKISTKAPSEAISMIYHKQPPSLVESEYSLLKLPQFSFPHGNDQLKSPFNLSSQQTNDQSQGLLTSSIACNTEDERKSIEIKAASKRRTKSNERVKKKSLPLIIRAADTGAMNIHIVGEGDHSERRRKSQNNTPAKVLDERDFHHKQKASYHVFRDIEVINKEINSLPGSKLRVMKEYDKNTVKKEYLPKVSINKGMELESQRLKRLWEKSFNRFKFVKLF